MRADSACLLSDMGETKKFNSGVEKEKYATKYALDIKRKYNTHKRVKQKRLSKGKT